MKINIKYNKKEILIRIVDYSKKERVVIDNIVEDMLNFDDTKNDNLSLKRCVPCSNCNIKPVWGSGFLVCQVCGKESEYEKYSGCAVRSWNKMNGVSR